MVQIHVWRRRQSISQFTPRSKAYGTWSDTQGKAIHTLLSLSFRSGVLHHSFRCSSSFLKRIHLSPCEYLLVYTYVPQNLKEYIAWQIHRQAIAGHSRKCLVKQVNSIQYLTGLSTGVSLKCYVWIFKVLNELLQKARSDVQSTKNTMDTEIVSKIKVEWIILDILQM